MTEKYSFVSRKEDEWASILIDSGEFTGIIYQYVRYQYQRKRMKMATCHSHLNTLLLIIMDTQKNP